MFIILNDLRAMEKYAEEYNIPIMERRGLKFLVDYIKSKNVKSILEIDHPRGNYLYILCESTEISQPTESVS